MDDLNMYYVILIGFLILVFVLGWLVDEYFK